MLASSIIAPLCVGLQKKAKTPKPPEIAVLAVTITRIEDDVSVDGKLRVQCEKPVKALHLFIDFLNSDKKLLSTKRGEVTDTILETGDEPEFKMRVVAPTRAVYYTLRAEDGDGRDLRVENEGPFAIE
jgi:hypothetical protein